MLLCVCTFMRENIAYIEKNCAYKHSRIQCTHISIFENLNVFQVNIFTNSIYVSKVFKASTEY